MKCQVNDNLHGSCEMQHKLRGEQLPDVLLAQHAAQSCGQWLHSRAGLNFFNKLPCNCSSSFLNVMVIIAAYKKNMSELCILRKKTVYGFINAWVPNVIKLNACIGRYIPTD